MISKRIYTHFIALLSWGFSCQDVLATDNKWPFLISADGSPIVSISVGPPVTKGIKAPYLRHQIEYDGSTYYSAFRLIGVLSYLTPLNDDNFLWETPGGEFIIISKTKPTLAFGRSWMVRDAAPEGASKQIESSAGDLYSFINCEVIYAKTDQYELTFERIANTIKIWSGQSREVPTIVLTLNNSHQPVGIVNRGTLYRLSYNENQQLASAGRSENPANAIYIKYENKLISRIGDQTNRSDFIWGQMKWSEYYKPITPLPPIVINDGQWRYSFTRDTYNIHAVANNETEAVKKRIRWTLNLRSNRILTKEESN